MAFVPDLEGVHVAVVEEAEPRRRGLGAEDTLHRLRERDHVPLPIGDGEVRGLAAFVFDQFSRG